MFGPSFLANSNFLNGTLTQAPDSSQGTLHHTPYKNFTTPASYLLANRWLFLPTSPAPLEDDYICPESVKLRLEEDVTDMKKEKDELLTDVELFEACEFIIKWVVQKSGSDELVEFIMEKND
ncbi:uncharacterized protein MELLADRAFT_103916 [Melampsora larici-populina 98AG31]|uniref:Uncharacterized protein n=1 Tax=Melampsora larici-populina (strain 98AG31 / pathotype 3-4-7) TaxID=747676 RepID=F4RCZ5_MELLP|nr:uncharacterized protein MELLADRAFT_103916 [Melampsora larici-populina 98AG31]EGG09809.1 hypothetical protein MELLADRAFT_103916 [Melampsora larici-populina 98AG31]